MITTVKQRRTMDKQPNTNDNEHHTLPNSSTHASI